MMRVVGCLCMILLLALAAVPLAADSFPVVLQGKVVTEDGDPPPVTVSVERICSDDAGSTNGVLTNKKESISGVWTSTRKRLARASCALRMPDTFPPASIFRPSPVLTAGDRQGALVQMQEAVAAALMADYFV